MQLGARTTGGMVSVRVTSGGSGYASAPTVTIGGTASGVSAYCQMNGSVVQGVCVVSPGTGLTGNPAVVFSGGSGSGAAAVAYASTTSIPMSFFKGRHADVYGVDGMGRGIRWDGASSAVEDIGINPPAFGPALTCTAATTAQVVKSVQIAYAGAGYYATPTVSFSGGTPTRAASAKAEIQNGAVVSITVTDPGAGYQAPPAVSISGGIGSGAALTANVIGCIAAARIIAQGTSYALTSAPTVTFSTTNGLTNAAIRAVRDGYGGIGSAIVIAAGTGATSGVVAEVNGGGGTGAVIGVDMQYRVTSVSVANSGSGYYVAPVVTFLPDPADPNGYGAAATASVNAAGQITAITVVNGGSYSLPPTAVIQPTSAEAQVETSSPLAGKYLCCIRYLDDTPTTQNGPVASSISPLIEVDAGTGASELTWSFTHGALDARVSAMELWRTSADQSVILFRVATIQRASFSSTYSDTISDDDLIDTGRNGYALMPITLPSGQINARRFGVPPGEFSVGCMFQDRAWYAVDSTGQRPNALMYSEVDEPESVPAENELVVQENTGESDRIVSLVPLGGALLIVQTAHIYKLTYVAQPVIDASMLLVANRGVLHHRCWASMNGVVFLVDSQGMYAFDGQQEEAVSIAIDNYWRDGSIDFSKADQFHVAADQQTKTVRFYYCGASDTSTTRALCYCVATKAWWEEVYATAITATCRVMLNNKVQTLHADSGVRFSSRAGATDNGTAIDYNLRTGAMALQNEPGSRSVDVLFAPTISDATLNLSLHYNNSSTPRANAIASDRGGGFITATGSTAATLKLNKTRSALGDASGQARAFYSGRADDRSVGADKHMAVAVSGQQTTDSIVIHKLAIDGVG